MKRMTDERERFYVELAEAPHVPGEDQQSELTAEMQRARAREARLEAALRGMLAAFPRVAGALDEADALKGATAVLDAE